VLAPVLPGGIAVIGDPALYACAGDTRIASVVTDDDGRGVTVTVLGANEHVRILGWSEHPIVARAWAPAAGRSDVVSDYDTMRNTWEIAADVGDAGWVKLHLRPRD
jgi:hypothetical protein